MKRIDKFHSLKNHAHYSRYYTALKQRDIALISKFISENETLDKANFEMKMNRFFLELKDRPKNWAILSELLMIANNV